MGYHSQGTISEKCNMNTESTHPPRFQKISGSSIAHALSLAIFCVVDHSFLYSQENDAQQVAKELDSEKSTKRFLPDVVAKAQKILADAGLKASGSHYTSLEMANVSKSLTSLTREKRELKKVYDEWLKVSQQLADVNQKRRQLNVQYGNLSGQLAAVAAGDVTSNNRIVGMINATVALQKEIEEQRQEFNEELGRRRAALNEGEANYTSKVLAIRDEFDLKSAELGTRLLDPKLKIAFEVMKANESIAIPESADDIVNSISRRLLKVEQEVFRESIPLDVRSNSLYANVVIDGKTVSMVVDSGASVVSLPAKIANDLGIVVKDSDPELTMIMADGRSVAARGVVIPMVRVGTFEVENVEAAVLSDAAFAAEPLLGNSFLSHFRSEIDQSAKTLRLTRVVVE
jgi:clan AA aspartic protease (TIGR02281 family)